MTSIPDMMRVIGRLDLRSLRFLRTASAALPLRVFLDLQERFSVPVIEAFGMTETLSHCFSNPLSEPCRIGTVGLPDGVEAQIDSNHHLWLRGPCVFTNQWFDTGDLAQQDELGYYRILGRSGDQINVRGIKIDPLSIENQLYSRFPTVSECAVFGKQALKCVYAGDVAKKEVSEWLSSLGSHCRPILIHQVDSIPKNHAGKVSKSLLEDLYI